MSANDSKGQPQWSPQYIELSDEWIYQFWLDNNFPRGVLRKTKLDSYILKAPKWEVILDINKLSEKEGKLWTFAGYKIIPKVDSHCDRMMATLKCQSGEVTLREMSLTKPDSIVEDGFILPLAKDSTITWYDRDTLLLVSTLGDGRATKAGWPRTIRLWKRGTEVQEARPLFEIPIDHHNIDVLLDRSDGLRLLYAPQIDEEHGALWIGDISGVHTRLDLPDMNFDVNLQDNWLILCPYETWTLDQIQYAPGTVLVIEFSAFLEGSRLFETLYTPSGSGKGKNPKRIFGWIGGFFFISVFENDLLSCKYFKPSEPEWTCGTLDHLLPCDELASITALNREEGTFGALLIKRKDSHKQPLLLLQQLVESNPSSWTLCDMEAPSTVRNDLDEEDEEDGMVRDDDDAMLLMK